MRDIVSISTIFAIHILLLKRFSINVVGHDCTQGEVQLLVRKLYSNYYF